VVRVSDSDWLIFPVGHDLGPYFPRRDEPLQHYEVCLGRRAYGLPSHYDYAVWMRAHGPVDDPPLTYTQYRDNLLADRIPEPGARAARLAADGLLFQVPWSGAGAVEFALAFRLMPLVTAIGNVGPDIPAGRYALGRPTMVFHYADELEYWLWLWGGHHDNLWLACESLARTQLGAATGDGDPHRCVGPALLAVQRLINHSLAFLDAAWDRR
jgi:hypothetical protein